MLHLRARVLKILGPVVGDTIEKWTYKRRCRSVLQAASWHSLVKARMQLDELTNIERGVGDGGRKEDVGASRVELWKM